MSPMLKSEERTGGGRGSRLSAERRACAAACEVGEIHAPGMLDCDDAPGGGILLRRLCESWRRG